MLKPKSLRPGDTVALVSLSAGLAGDTPFRHRVALARRRLQTEFGLNTVAMPNAMRGSDFLDKNPAARAADLMQAFADEAVHAVVCMLGGDDTIRLLPHIDFDLLRRNPKIFMGYSDTTVNHFMLYKAGVMSYYGPCALVEFAENGAMHPYTVQYLRQVLFQPPATLPIRPSPQWTSEFLDWADEANDDIPRAMRADGRGYELLQGSGVVQGALIGGCIDVFSMLVGTELWPEAGHWAGKILFLETSEECPPPSAVKYFLRGLAAQGILARAGGILFGKPRDERYYDEYKAALSQVAGEAGRPDLPILYNLNFGHTAPICTLPYGALAEIDCGAKSLRLLEPGTRPAAETV